MYTLYSMQRSGNCYKVRLALAQLGVPYKIIDVDILKGDARTPDFLGINPSGRVPVLEVAQDRYLSESNAILWYIALYGYPHLAHQADFDLAAFPSIRAWLNRVVDQPGHVPMDWHPAAEAAE